jgi:acetolactate synthase-1/2/3 large subunit
MAEITGGELLARCLANEGVKFIFGLPCPEIDPLLAALENYDIRLVPIRHEAAAVHMAEGVYRTSGQVAVVLGNPGPGSANLLPGVITARHEGVPVIVITSQHRPEIVYPSPPSTFQGQDQLDVFKPVVKWGAPVFNWGRIPEIVRMAYREMWLGRPGPVQIEAPMPILYETGEEAKAPIFPPQQYRCGLPQPAETQIREAAELLAAAQRPLVISGSGVDRSGANAALMEIVEMLNCPVFSTMAGRSTVPIDHPNHINGFGAAGDTVKREADVVLVAGSRLGNLDLPYDKYWGDAEKHKFIQIDIDPRNMGVTRPITLGIVADVRPTLDGIVKALKGMDAKQKDGKDLARYRKAAQESWDKDFKMVEDWPGPSIHPARAMQAVAEIFGKNAIYFADGGMTGLWAHQFLPATWPRSYHSILELGMLGIGIPYAVGAKLANPDREVVCVTGDGAAGFNFMEMQSAAREKLNITTVVFAEGQWTMEIPNEMMLWGKTFGTEMGEVRWDKVGEGLGCTGFYAEKAEEVGPAIKAAKETAGPSVVCLKTDLQANLAVPEDLMMRFFEVYQGPQ